MKTHLFARLLILFALAFLTSFPSGVEAQGCSHQWGWSHTLEFPPGFWEAGAHEYEFLWSAPSGNENCHVEFQASAEVPRRKGQVILRFWGLTSVEGVVEEINPAQDTALQLTWLASPPRAEAADSRLATTLQVHWDGGEWVDVPAGPLTNWCAYDNPAHFMRSWGPKY